MVVYGFRVSTEIGQPASLKRAAKLDLDPEGSSNEVLSGHFFNHAYTIRKTQAPAITSKETSDERKESIMPPPLPFPQPRCAGRAVRVPGRSGLAAGARTLR